MLKRILVPLDVSLLAESALPVAVRIKYVSDGTILLQQVIALPAQHSVFYGSDMAQCPQLAQDMLDTEQENAERYLAEVCSLEILSGIQVGE